MKLVSGTVSLSLYELAGKAYDLLSDDAPVESFEAWATNIWNKREHIYPVSILRGGETVELAGFVLAYPDGDGVLFVEWCIVNRSFGWRFSEAILTAYIQSIPGIFGPTIKKLVYDRRGKRRAVDLETLMRKVSYGK